MPFKSKAQEAWAFSTGQPWAKEWASKTNQKSLPQRAKEHKTRVMKHLIKIKKKNKYADGLSNG